MIIKNKRKIYFNTEITKQFTSTIFVTRKKNGKPQGNRYILPGTRKIVI